MWARAPLARAREWARVRGMGKDLRPQSGVPMGPEARPLTREGVHRLIGQVVALWRRLFEWNMKKGDGDDKLVVSVLRSPLVSLLGLWSKQVGGEILREFALHLFLEGRHLLTNGRVWGLMD